MDAFLNFFITNLAVIIQWLIAVILLLVGSWLVLLIMGKGRQKSSGSLDVSDLGSLESTLREIAQKGIAAVPAPAAGLSEVEVSDEAPGEGAVALDGAGNASMEKIMQELAQKEAEIQILKASAPADDAPEVDISSYLEKIKDLEGKLAEYEIIEDDIADLSMYKEENARLKQQLGEMGEAVGATSGVEEAAAEPAPPEEDEAPVVEKGEDLVKEFAAAVEVTEGEPAGEEPTNEIEGAAEGSVDLTSDLDILNQAIAETNDDLPDPGDSPAEAKAEAEAEADADAAPTPEAPVDSVPEVAADEPVAEPDVVPEVKAAPEVEPEAKGAPEPAAEEPAPAAEEDTVLEPPPVEDGAADDILAEFTKTLTDSIPELNKKAKPAPKAKFVEEKEPEPGASGESTDAEGGPVDTERMLAEMADLEAAAASGGGGGDLEDEVDTEKMAAEAAKLISGE